jgi:MFS family permease
MWNENTSPWHLWLDIVFQGFGMASLITTTLIAMIASVKRSDVGVSIGVTYLFRTTGQVLGVSLSGALLQATLASKLRQRITMHGAEAVIDQIRHSTSIIPDLEPWLRKAAIDSYADSLRVVFLAITASSLLALIFTIPIQENPLPGSMEEQEQQYEEREAASSG